MAIGDVDLLSLESQVGDVFLYNHGDVNLTENEAGTGIVGDVRLSDTNTSRSSRMMMGIGS